MSENKKTTEKDIEQNILKVKERIKKMLDGKRGEQGESGLQGERGDSGTRGYRGAKGDKGIDGKAGINGKDVDSAIVDTMALQINQNTNHREDSDIHFDDKAQKELAVNISELKTTTNFLGGSSHFHNNWDKLEKISGVRSFTASIGDDGDWDSEVIPLMRTSEAITITKVVGSTQTSDSGSLAFQLEQRSNINSVGTDIMSSSLTADADGSQRTSFNDATVPDDTYIAFITDSSAETNTVDLISVTVEYTIT